MAAKQFDYIWEAKLGLVHLLPKPNAETNYRARFAALITKDSKDQPLNPSVPHPSITANQITLNTSQSHHFIPYDSPPGEQVPLVINVGNVDDFHLSIYGITPEGKTVKIEETHFSQSVPLSFYDQSQTRHITLTSFGQLNYVHERSDGVNEILTEFGRLSGEFDCQGVIDSAEIMDLFLNDLPSGESRDFTPFFITATPCIEGKLTPSFSLKPQTLFQYLMSLEINAANNEADQIKSHSVRPAYQTTGQSMAMKKSAIMTTMFASMGQSKRSKSAPLKDQSSLTFSLKLGRDHEMIDFALNHGRALHWRVHKTRPHQASQASGEPYHRGFEPLYSQDDPHAKPVHFELTPFHPETHIRYYQADAFIQWHVDEISQGDIVGLVFPQNQSFVNLFYLQNRNSKLLASDQYSLFLYIGGDLIPLDLEQLHQWPQNQAIIDELKKHLNILSQPQAISPLSSTLRDICQRERRLTTLLSPHEIDMMINASLSGIQFEIYRDHILRAAQKISAIPNLFFSADREAQKLKPLMTVHSFFQHSTLIHSLIFNDSLRALYQQQHGQIKKANNLLETFLKARGFHDQLIQWVLHQTVEAQAIFWQMAGLHPDLIPLFYNQKILPDQSFNIFDPQSVAESRQLLSQSLKSDEPSEKAEMEGKHQERTPVEEPTSVPPRTSNEKQNESDNDRPSLDTLRRRQAILNRANDDWQQFNRTAKELINPFLAPLCFETKPFQPDEIEIECNGEDQQTKAAEITSLQNRLRDLIAEQQEGDAGDEFFENAVSFAENTENVRFLQNIIDQFEKAKKYKARLKEGYQWLIDQLNLSDDQILSLQQIDRAALPKITDLDEPLQRQLNNKMTALEQQLQKAKADFQSKTDSEDETFAELFGQASAPLEGILYPLAWYEVLRPVEEKYLRLINAVKQTLLGASQRSERLRHNSSAHQIIQDMALAESRGLYGWPEIMGKIDEFEQLNRQHKLLHD